MDISDELQAQLWVPQKLHVFLLGCLENMQDAQKW